MLNGKSHPILVGPGIHRGRFGFEGSVVKYFKQLLLQVAGGWGAPISDGTSGLRQSSSNRMTQVNGKGSFTTGSLVRDSGLYEVFHSAHHLPHQVILIEGEPFPRCACCPGPVIFELRKAAHAFTWGAYSAVRLQELPVSEFDGLSGGSAREYRIRRLRRAEAGLREQNRREQTMKTSRQLQTAARKLCQKARELVATGQSHCIRAVQFTCTRNTNSGQIGNPPATTAINQSGWSPPA